MAVLKSSWDPHHLRAIAGALAAPGRDRRDADLLAHVLCEALTDGGLWGTSLADGQRKAVDGLLPSHVDDMGHVIRALARMNRRPEHPRLLTELVSWLDNRMPDTGGFELLGALRALGCSAAERALARVISDEERFDQAQRRAAQLQVMVPLRNPLFADLEEDA